MPRTIWLDEVASTNTYAAQVADTLGHGDVVAARAQSAGRGQRGNSWEAAPGLNLTFSLMLRPQGVEAAGQFRISQAVALGVALTLERAVPGVEIAVKWPNDIYAADRKICGILIENVVTGRLIDRSVAGIGINVNQREFVSDAPNPVSLHMLTGREYDLVPLLERVRRETLRLLEADPSELDAAYMARLWRREGTHPFVDNTRGGITFMASIASVAPSGALTLIDTEGTPRQYYFKEVSFVL